ncbi:MAG: PBP1A family penicillin-binding protein [Rhodospirillales bacterium]|jgi:penicillin-binding protein 1A|nr:PBP1A family penicillin-binding protein [Rhodospirillales bacterium]
MSNPEKSKPAKKPQKASGGGLRVFGRMLRFIFYWGLIATIWGTVAVGGVLGFYAFGLPDVEKAFSPTRRPAVTVLAHDEVELASVGDLYGLAVRLEDLPSALPQAVIATEDRRYYEHFGLDIIGLARAVWVNVSSGSVRQGGSTITQQVAKNLFLTPERTYARKVREAMLAVWLESRFSKDEILSVYLNRMYFGSGTWGVDGAARKYFGVPASRISTWQAAMLAGMLKAPSRYNPINSEKKAAERTQVVLNNMVAAGYLSVDAAAKAKKNKQARVSSGKSGGNSRYFVDWVLKQVPGYVSVDRDVVVRTTLDSKIQRGADLAVSKHLDGAGTKQNVSQAALVVMTPQGAVRALVGGKSYAKSQYNRATQARRQPGSAFKPLVYLAGLEAGLRDNSVLTDEPININGWKPRNFDKKFRGPVSLQEALAKSINTISVQVARHAGYGNVAKVAGRLGVRGNLGTHPSLALGSVEVSLLDLTGAYAVLANGGHGVWPFAILEITARDGEVLYKRSGSGPGRVVTAHDASVMNAMMAGVIETGTGHNAAIGRPAAGKTGTSQNFRDGWFVGFTADLVAGVWMGNDDGSAPKKLTGGGLPAMVWRDTMKTAHKGMPQRSLFGTRVIDLPDEQQNLPQAQDNNQSGGIMELLSDFFK